MLRYLVSRQIYSAALPLALAGALAACAEGRHVTDDKAGEIPSGPGLISGADGRLTLYGEDEVGRPDIPD